MIVSVIPRASRDEIISFGSQDDDYGVLRVRVKAPPVDGRVNQALARFVARRLVISSGDVRVISGQTARRKMVSVAGLSSGEIRSHVG